MEYFGNNSNINRVDLDDFISTMITKKGNQSESRSWLSVEDDTKEQCWNYVTDQLSQIEGCMKIVKTIHQGEDLFLFIAEDISTKYIRKVNEKYSVLLGEVDAFFDVRVLNSNEAINWEDNKDNVVYWEKSNA